MATRSNATSKSLRPRCCFVSALALTRWRHSRPARHSNSMLSTFREACSIKFAGVREARRGIQNANICRACHAARRHRAVERAKNHRPGYRGRGAKRQTAMPECMPHAVSRVPVAEGNSVRRMSRRLPGLQPHRLHQFADLTDRRFAPHDNVRLDLQGIGGRHRRAVAVASSRTFRSLPARACVKQMRRGKRQAARSGRR